MRLRPVLSAESHLDSTRLVVEGQAQSVYDLYKKMVLGSIDAADYIRPCEYEDNPDIDNPSVFNAPGVTLEDLHAERMRVNNVLQLEKEKKEKEKKEKEVTTPTPPTPTPPTPPTE